MPNLLIFLIVLFISQPLLARDDAELEQELQYLQAEKLGWIEVVSKQKEDKNTASGIVSVITRDDIERYGGNNLFEILNRVTSLYMLGDSIFMKGAPSIRGDLSDSLSSHVLILMNGRPIRDSDLGGHTETVFRDFPIHHIRQIEVIRGPGSALYGTNAYSGVINIVTQHKKDAEVTLRGRYGSYGTGQIESEFAWKDTDMTVTGAIRYRNSNGSQFSALTNDYSGNAQRSTFRLDEDDISASMTAQWKNLSFNSFVTRTTRNQWGPAFQANGGHYQQARIFADIGYKNTFNNHWTSQWNLTYNHVTDLEEIPAPPDFDYATPGRLSENNLLFEQTQFLNFFNRRLNFLAGSLLEWQSGRINQATVGVFLPQYNHLKSSLYGEINYIALQNLPLIHELKLTVGGQWHRTDHLETSPTGLADPAIEGKVGRLGIVYEITPTFGLKLLYSQAFRAAAAFEAEVNAAFLHGDRNLQPERVETSTAQLFFHEQNYQASLTAFRTRQSNLIILNNALAQQYSNTNSGFYQGLELETQTLLFDGLHWKGAYTFQTNHNQQERNNVSSMPNHLAKIGLSYDINEDFQASAFYTFASLGKILPNLPVINPAVGNDHLLTLNGNYRFDRLFNLKQNKHLTFTFYLDNLLNEKTNYPTINSSNYNSIPGNPGRTFFGELAMTF